MESHQQPANSQQAASRPLYLYIGTFRSFFSEHEWKTGRVLILAQPCPRSSLPRLPVKALDSVDRVYAFGFANFAT